MCRASGSTVEMIRSGAARWAIFQVPSSSCSTSWPATRASNPRAEAASWALLVLVLVLVLVLEGSHRREGVAHQRVDTGQPWPPRRRGGSAACPLTRSRARTPAPRQLPGTDPAHPADGGDQLCHGVLGGHGIVEQGRVESSTGLSLQHPGGIDHRAHGIEDPLRTLGLAQPGPPIGEHREVETLVIECEAAGGPSN